MTYLLDGVYAVLQDGAVIWTVDRPSLPESLVQAFGYRLGRQFAVPEASDLLARLRQLQDLGLALGLQTVPERGARERVIKWRQAPAPSTVVEAPLRAPSAGCWQCRSEPSSASRASAVPR